MTTKSDQNLIYTTRRPVGGQAVGFLVGGLACFAIAFLYFSTTVSNPGWLGSSMMRALIGSLFIIGVFFFAFSTDLLRSTVRIVLDSVGVNLETHLSRKSILWLDIERVERYKKPSMFGGESHAILCLIGRSGMPLATISDAIADFEALADEVIARVSATKNHSTNDAAAYEQRCVGRETKRMRCLAVIFGIATLMSACLFYAGIKEELHLRRYANEAVLVDAKIIRREMVRVTPHVEYMFEVDGQQYSRNVVMWQGPDYDALEGQKTVPVEYLRSDPNWSRLVAGENPGADFGGNFLFCSGGGIVFHGTLCILSILGFNIKTENGVTMLVRYGRTIKTWRRKSRGSSQKGIDVRE